MSVQNKSELLKAAEQAAAQAKRHGADQAAVAVARARGVDIEWRDGQLDRVQEQTRRSLSLEIFVDGRYSASSTNDLRPEAVDVFIAEAVAMTRLLEPDPHRGLSDPERYEGRADVDLDLADPTLGEVTAEARLEVAQRLEAIAREAGAHLPIVSVASSVSDSQSHSARVHTDGFVGERTGTSSSFSAMVTVKEEDGRRPMGWSYSARRHRGDLDSVEAVAREASVRAGHQLKAGKVDTGRYKVIVENRAVGRLLSALIAPLSGSALQQKRSLWDGKVGEQIVSPLLTIHDAPHVVRGLSSALWDGDGFATVGRPIIEAGVLRTYLIGQYYARKMGVEPTGASLHNLRWDLGDSDLEALVADVKEGVLIDRFLGGNSNATTGELSMGCGGRMIRDGQIAEPVGEVNLAGHFGELWQRLVAVGNDPYINGSSGCPSVVFEDVQLSGR